MTTNHLEDEKSAQGATIEDATIPEETPGDETNENGTGTDDGTGKKKTRKPSGEAFEKEMSVGRNTLKLSAEDPGLMACAAGVGYDAGRILEGQALFDALNDAYSTQKTAYIAQLNAYKKYSDLKDTSRTKAEHIVLGLLLALKDDPAPMAELKTD
ncbi:MAG: hypothetical protein GY757_50595, partial [bacterium]|nr:hypothetical protein [bacterium]